MTVRARIYRERPDWWLHIYRDVPGAGRWTYHRRRYWTWQGAIDAARKLLDPMPNVTPFDESTLP